MAGNCSYNICKDGLGNVLTPALSKNRDKFLGEGCTWRGLTPTLKGEGVYMAGIWPKPLRSHPYLELVLSPL